MNQYTLMKHINVFTWELILSCNSRVQWDISHLFFTTPCGTLNIEVIEWYRCPPHSLHWKFHRRGFAPVFTYSFYTINLVRVKWNLFYVWSNWFFTNLKIFYSKISKSQKYTPTTIWSPPTTLMEPPTIAATWSSITMWRTPLQPSMMIIHLFTGKTSIDEHTFYFDKRWTYSFEGIYEHT